MATTDRDRELGLQRLGVRLTDEAFGLLQAECDRRYRNTAARVPYGAVISEVLVEKLSPNGGNPVRKRPVVARVRRKLAKTA